MVGNGRADGQARLAVQEDPKADLAAMLTGLGSLSYGELAGERIKLGLMLHDPEEEHDCFSDNTHNSHFYNQVGMMRSEEHTSELQSLMRISYAVFCLKKKTHIKRTKSDATT